MTPDRTHWLTPKAAAAELECSLQTVIRRIDADPPRLIAENISRGKRGRRFLIDPASVESLKTITQRN